jgi:hypothetical protein
LPVNLLPEPDTRIPIPSNRLIASPFTVLSEAWISRPIASTPAFMPLIWTRSTASFPVARVFALAPACVNPLIVTLPVTGGSGVAGVIVLTPAPAMANSILSFPAVSLASWIAARSVHWIPAVACASHTASVRSRSLAFPTAVTVNALGPILAK